METHGYVSLLKIQSCFNCVMLREAQLKTSHSQLRSWDANW
ncbi:hypothetical protein PDIG_63470 [Penicillium digitatum PHI26]|uniref:Uncharacterized protein n=2 Tax=Penicillium digitatum TaxID=36651 RepID=K9FIW6_PEND2|nr:hypothetical protein PDIP_72840 [Penicillium digitatum Pd1]EKV07629.1 hypothetical protein PDIP_72840 [Penicillium digitatum Pd1]EKV09214.1 hypothetical protein PDIG_63470 [Penicillium digitatum PHI26]